MQKFPKKILLFLLAQSKIKWTSKNFAWWALYTSFGTKNKRTAI